MRQNKRNVSPSAGVRLRALVTGASSGIGLEYARQLAAAGHPLVLVSNQQEALQAVAAELTARYGVEVEAIYMDLAVEDAARQLYDRLEARGTEIGILINNAGIFSFNDVVATPEKRVETMLDLHVYTGTMLCRLFGEAMCRRKQGYILNMSSLSAWMPVPGIALYSATKSYLRVFSRALAMEMRPYGVGVTVVCPGGVATDLYGLAPRLQRLGVRLGVLMTPEKLVKVALRRMFRQRKQVIPGWINRLMVPIIAVVPDGALAWVKGKLSRYER